MKRYYCPPYMKQIKRFQTNRRIWRKQEQYRRQKRLKLLLTYAERSH